MSWFTATVHLKPSIEKDCPEVAPWCMPLHRGIWIFCARDSLRHQKHSLKLEFQVIESDEPVQPSLQSTMAAPIIYAERKQCSTLFASHFWVSKVVLTVLCNICVVCSYMRVGANIANSKQMLFRLTNGNVVNSFVIMSFLALNSNFPGK